MKTFTAAMVLLLLAGCASGDRQAFEPIVDLKGVNPARYQQDLAECLEYAEQVSIAAKAGTGAATGAAAGAVLGAVLGDGELAQRTAGAGAVTGGLSGGLSAVQEKQRVVSNCLRGRGYRVLN